MNPIIPPLAAHFVWHPNDQNKYSVLILEFRRYLTRDIDRPFSRELNIPTFFYSSSSEEEPPLNYPIKLAQRNVIFICLSRNTLINTKWTEYISSLETSNTHSIVPIALDEYALSHSSIEGSLKNRNFVRAFQWPEENKEKFAILFLSHELYRFGLVEINDGDVGVNSSVQLFLSHAKRGHTGVIYAKAIKDFIDETNIQKFFDANEISPGFEFDQEIINHIEKSTLVAITTDEYSSRYWCQREILEAKKVDRPIISVNCLEEYEDRIFPPAANVPCVHVAPSTPPKIEDILNILIAALIETIRFEHSKKLLAYYQEQKWIDPSAIILARPPEIQKIVYLNKEYGDQLSICYPEPPIYEEETDWVEFLNVKVSTPLWTNQDAPSRKKLKIGVSISEYKAHSYNTQHTNIDELKRFSQELARHLLLRGSSILYGGDLRAEGFTQFILDEASILKSRLPSHDFRVENHLAWPLYLKSEADDFKAKYFNVLKTVQHPIPEDIATLVDCKVWLDPKNVSDKYVWSRSLTCMRESSIACSDVRVFAGGKTENYLGKMPGVLEEFVLALKMEKPIFLVGGLGGIVKDICSVILDSEFSEVLTEDWQISNNSEYSNLQVYAKQLGYAADYVEIKKLIENINVEILAQRVGLSKEEYIQYVMAPIKYPPH